MNQQPDYLARAYALTPLQRYDLALADVQRALAADPEAAAPHICAAWVLRAASRFEEAEAAARAAVQAEPNNADAHTIYAITLRRLHRWDASEAAFQTALGLSSPDADRAFQVNHYARLLMDRGRLSEALTQAHDSLRLAPHWIYSHELLGRIMREQGRLGEAEAAFRAALRCDPSSAEVHRLLGDALLDSGRADAAITCLQTALQLAPGDTIAQKQLVRALKARFWLYRWGVQAQHWSKYHQRIQQRGIMIYMLLPLLILPVALISSQFSRVLLIGWLTAGMLALMGIACYICIDAVLNTLLLYNKQERAFLPPSHTSNGWLTLAIVLLGMLVIITVMTFARIGFRSTSMALLLLCISFGLPVLVIANGKRDT